MYGVFTYTFLTFMVLVNVGKCTIFGSYGLYLFFPSLIQSCSQQRIVYKWKKKTPRESLCLSFPEEARLRKSHPLTAC